MTSQPNANVRRHNSLPSSVRRSTPTLQRMSQQMKFNPYVGWFRHSPETTRTTTTRTPAWNTRHLSLSSATAINSFSTTTTKTMPASPYLGYLRHSPTMAMFRFVQAEFRNWLKVTLPAMKITCDHVQELADFLAGRLRGGSPSWYYNNTDKKPSQTSSHMEVNARLLKRIAGWILAPFLLEDSSTAEDKEKEYHSSSSSSLKSLDNESLTTVDENDEQPPLHDNDSEDISDTSSSSSLSGEQPPEKGESKSFGSEELVDRRCKRSDSVESSSSAMQGAVSSQVEAYYAHQAARDLNPDEVIPSRLDYVITQMDIIRMQRNASRHLDVDSIYQLPTITYLKNKPTTTMPSSAEESNDDKKSAAKPPSEGWSSWMLVSHAAAEENDNDDDDKSLSSTTEQVTTAEKSKEDVCVICLEPYVYGDRLRVLPCNHSFHVGCIDRWLSGSASFEDCHTAGCPTCKKRPIQEEEEEQNENNELRQDGSVPSWAFSQLGSALLERDSKQQLKQQECLG